MKKMSFGERIRITKRGFGILRKYCPGLSEQKALYEFIHSLQPFITIWFSARIVDELTNHCRKDYIASYVICVITINFICIVFQNVILIISILSYQEVRKHHYGWDTMDFNDNVRKDFNYG